jgi:GNAT superfamily N-acetyltransferase
VETTAFRTRSAGPTDARALAAIRVASWRAGYAGIVPDAVLDALDVDAEADRWTTILRDAPAKGQHVEFVLDRRDVVVGYAAIGSCTDLEDDLSVGELMAFYLHPDAWGSGAADPLIERAEALLADRGHTEAVLWVFDANARARRFYERHDWTPDGHVEMRNGIGGADIPRQRYRKNLTS